MNKLIYFKYISKNICAQNKTNIFNLYFVSVMFIITKINMSN